MKGSNQRDRNRLWSVMYNDAWMGWMGQHQTKCSSALNAHLATASIDRDQGSVRGRHWKALTVVVVVAVDASSTPAASRQPAPARRLLRRWCCCCSMSSATGWCVGSRRLRPDLRRAGRSTLASSRLKGACMCCCLIELGREFDCEVPSDQGSNAAAVVAVSRKRRDFFLPDEE